MSWYLYLIYSFHIVSYWPMIPWFKYCFDAKFRLPMKDYHLKHLHFYCIFILFSMYSAVFVLFFKLVSMLNPHAIKAVRDDPGVLISHGISKIIGRGSFFLLHNHSSLDTLTLDTIFSGQKFLFRYFWWECISIRCLQAGRQISWGNWCFFPYFFF